MADIDISKCSITRYPAQVLSKKAQPIERIDDDIKKLAERMIDIMHQQKGVGLAGPQAGVNLQIFVISLDGSKEGVRVYINPQVETCGDIEAIEEGCLSVPGVYNKIYRYKKCKVTATDLEGNEFTEDADGLYARVLQHENDHLQGIMIKDRMGTVAKIAHRKQFKKLEEDYKGESSSL